MLNCVTKDCFLVAIKVQSHLHWNIPDLLPELGDYITIDCTVCESGIAVLLCLHPSPKGICATAASQQYSGSGAMNTVLSFRSHCNRSNRTSRFFNAAAPPSLPVTDSLIYTRKMAPIPVKLLLCVKLHFATILFTVGSKDVYCIYVAFSSMSCTRGHWV